MVAGASVHVTREVEVDGKLEVTLQAKQVTISHLVHSGCTAGARHEELEAVGLQLRDDLPQEVTEGPTGPHHLFPHHLDIEGVGGVTASSKLDSELGGGDAKQLLSCLAEVSLPCRLSWV